MDTGISVLFIAMTWILLIVSSTSEAGIVELARCRSRCLSKVGTSTCVILIDALYIGWLFQ